MILKYGSYAHEIAEASISISKTKTFRDTGQVSGFKETWLVEGRLEAASVAALTTKINALETAYSNDGLDLILFDVDGTTQTSHKLINSTTLYGVQISDFGYPEGKNAEYSTFRNYKFTAIATYLASGDAGDNVMSYQSQISYVGTGGAKFTVRPMISGPPVKQQIFAATPVMATQSGSRTGLIAYPASDDPLYVSDEQVDARQITRSSALDGGSPKFTTSWTYKFLKTVSF